MDGGDFWDGFSKMPAAHASGNLWKDSVVLWKFSRIRQLFRCNKTANSASLRSIALAEVVGGHICEFM